MKNPIKKILTEISFYSGRYLLPPQYICLNLTYRCNFRCLSCQIWQIKNQKELPTRDWIKIIRELKEILPKKTGIEVSGGEPLLEKEKLIALIKEIRKYFDFVSINSNGSLLNQKNLLELQRAGLKAIKLSFYSLEEKIHNQLKGNSGAYNDALQTIELALKFKLKIMAGILITQKNINGLPRLINFLSAKPLTEVILQPLDEIIVSSAAKDLTKNCLPQALWPSKKQITKLFNYLRQNRQKIKNSKRHLALIKKYYLNPKSTLKRRCFVGQNNLVIDPNGEVKFCFKYPAVGRITRKSIRQILKSSKAAAERRKIRSCKKFCRVVGCNYSRGIWELIRGY